MLCSQCIKIKGETFFVCIAYLNLSAFILSLLTLALACTDKGVLWKWKNEELPLMVIDGDYIETQKSCFWHGGRRLEL